MEYNPVEIERFRARTPKSLQVWQRTKEVVRLVMLAAWAPSCLIPSCSIGALGRGSRTSTATTTSTSASVTGC